MNERTSAALPSAHVHEGGECSATECAPSVASGRDGRRHLALVLCAAVVCKVLYLAEYLSLPFLYGPLFDSQVYLLQARRITEGRFGDATLLAFSPLYGYFLALLGAHQGSILPVLVQLGLGALNVLLLHRITARLFGSRAALAAALLYLGYGPCLFFESKIMSETLGLTLMLCTLERMSRRSFWSERGTSTQLTAGACAALAILARASFLPAAPLLAVAACLREAGPASEAAPRRPRAQLRRGFIFAAALVLVLAAHGGWTKLQSGLFVPVILVSNTAARATQHAWTGDLSVFRAGPEQLVGAFSVVEQARARLKRARRAEPEPVGEPFSLPGYLTQAPSKLWLTLRDGETSFDYGFYGERTEVWPLRLCVVSFGMLLAFALVGLVGACRERKLRALSPLLALGLGTLLTTTLFHPSTRYRLPLLLLLLPLAGYAWQLALALEPPRRRMSALAALGLVGLAFALHQGLRPLDRPAFWQLRVAEAALEEGDFATARLRLVAARQLALQDPQARQRAQMLESRLPRLAP